MNGAPSFFKFFIAEIDGIEMKIPVAFMSHMEEALLEKVFLRDRHNNVWTVNVAKVGNHWYFVDGWEKFVLDNLLVTGDLLVFKYFSSCVVNVRVYGPSATEKNVTRSSTTKDHSENNDIFYVNDDNDEDGENKDCVPMKQDRDTDDNDDNDDDDDTNVTTSQENTNQNFQRQANNGGDGVNRNTIIYFSAKCYGIELFEAGLAQQPKNPYFVTKIEPKRKSNLFIPMDVIKDYNLNLHNGIILVDPNGKEFRTRCRKWKNGRWVLSGGWRSLCRVNFIALEDTCICEFVPKEGDRRLFLHINLVRAHV